MKIIETIEDFEIVLDKINKSDFILVPYFVDTRSHVAVNELSLLWVYDLLESEGYIIVLNHNEGIPLPEGILEKLKSEKCAFVLNKKQLLHKLSNLKLMDVQSLEYLHTGSPVETEKVVPLAMAQMDNLYWQYTNVGKAVPMMTVVKYFWDMTAIIQRIISQYGEYQKHSSYTFLNEIAIPTLYSIERVGLRVNPEVLEGFYKGVQKYANNGLVYSDYNLFTSAGRPSNKYGNLNFAALAKKSGIREAFISRYDNGRLVMIDFESFHLRLIAELMGFPLPSEPVHEFLGKQYFQTEELTPEQYDEGKTITFQLMYSDTPASEMDMPFFKKMYEYTAYLWELVNLQGFITSPISNRKINLSHIENPTPAKVFNYLVQLTETEYNLQVLYELKSVFNQMIGKPILYTYDAILIDMPLSDMPMLKDIVTQLEQGGKFPVRVYHGETYQTLEKVNR